MSSQLVKFLASATTLLVIAGVFGVAAGLAAGFVQRGEFPAWIRILITLLALSLSFVSYKVACRTPFGRRYLFNWLGGPNGT